MDMHAFEGTINFKLTVTYLCIKSGLFPLNLRPLHCNQRFNCTLVYCEKSPFNFAPGISSSDNVILMKVDILL